jgi:hypothetical protein
MIVNDYLPERVHDELFGFLRLSAAFSAQQYVIASPPLGGGELWWPRNRF